MAWHVGGLSEAQDVEKRGEPTAHKVQPIQISQAKGSSRMEGAFENVFLLTIKTLLAAGATIQAVASSSQLLDARVCGAGLSKDALSEGEHFV